MKSRLRSACSIAVLAALSSTLPAYGQEAGDEDTGASTEIIVTAQKRNERLQDVPLSVTALTSEALENRQITDTSGLTQLAPSLTFQQGNNPSNASFRIRGIGTSLFGQGTEPSVSVVLDGVVAARQAQGFADLIDVERIEILRGPQGTLFGKNSTAGVISVVTARPSKEWTGRLLATVAEFDEYRIAGTVSGPINDKIGLRVTGFYNDVGGYIENVVRGDKANGFESYGVRGKLEIEPTEGLNLLFSAEYRKNDAECCQQVLIRSDNPTLTALVAPVVPGPRNTQVATNLPITNETSQETYSLNASYELGSVQLTSITAYQKFTFNNNVDADGINTDVPRFTGPSFSQFDLNGGPIDLDNFTQEFQISSIGQNRLNYVVGVFYSKLNLDRGFSRRLAQCPAGRPVNVGLAIGAACPSPLFLSGGHTAQLENESYAAFGQFDYTISGGLKLLGGLRVQHETLAVAGQRTGQSLIAGDLPLFGPITGRVSTSDSEVTGKAGLQYEFSRRAQVYATYTRGYKGPGLDTEVTTNFATQIPVEPETADAYEIGFKGSTSDGRLTLAASLFWTDFKNLQVQANRSDPGTGNFIFVQTNAGTAQTKGFEIEATLRPDDNLTIGLSGSYVDATADVNGLGCPLQSQAAAVVVERGGAQPANTCFVQRLATGGLSGAQQNVRGGYLPASPNWRFAINPRYEREVGNYRAFADLSLSYQSDQFFAIEQDPLLVQDGYAVVDLAVGITPKDTGFSASVFVKNLFDTRFYSTMGHNALLTTATLTPNNLGGFLPKNAFRYIGATVGYSF